MEMIRSAVPRAAAAVGSLDRIREAAIVCPDSWQWRRQHRRRQRQRQRQR